MVEIIATVIVAYVLFTIGLGALIGRGHGPVSALVSRVPVGPHRALHRVVADHDRGVGWDPLPDSATSDDVAWDLVA